MTVFNQNRYYGFFLGLLSTFIWWYTLILLSQKRVAIKRRHYIGLLLAVIGYTLWFFKFSYIIRAT